jgi:hypothetical protein
MKVPATFRPGIIVGLVCHQLVLDFLLIRYLARGLEVLFRSQIVRPSKLSKEFHRAAESWQRFFLPTPSLAYSQA